MEEAQNRQNDIGEVYAGQKPKGKRLSAKSIVLIVLSVVFLAAAVLVPVLLLTSKNKIAYKEETVGDWVRQYNASTKTYDIIRYIGEPSTININGVTYENAVLIPLELDGISIGFIRAHAFDANENDTLLQVENIVFETGTQISKIGDYAFDSCKNLKQIQIPASVKNVGSYAFNNCINLEKITIENAYGFTFSENALKGTDKLKTLEILSVTDNFDQSNPLGNIGSLNSNNNDLNLELGQGVNGIGSGFIASGVKELTVFNYKNLAIDSSTLYSVETLNIKYFGEGDETDTLTARFMDNFKSASNLKNINILDKEINKIGLYALTSFSGIEKLIVSSGTSFDINFTNTSDGTSHNANLAIYFKEDSDCSVTFYTTLLTNGTLGQNLINKFASDEKNKISTIIIEDSISQITCGINSEDGFKLVKTIKFVDNGDGDYKFSNVGNTFFSTQASNPFVVDNGIGLNIEGPENYNNAIFKNFNAPKGVFYKRASYNCKEEFGAVVINLVKVDKNGIRISNSTDRFIEVPVGVNIADYIIRTDADSVDTRYENPIIAIKLIVNDELTFLPIDGVKFALATEGKISGTYDVDTQTMYVSNTFNVDGKVVEDDSTYQVYMVYEAQKTPVYFESYYNNIGSNGYGLYGESVSQPLATGETEEINIDKPGVIFDIETTKDNNELIADLISYEDGKLVIIVDTSKIHNGDTIKLYYTRKTYEVTISQNPDSDTVNEPSVPSETKHEVTYGQNFTWLTEISVSRDGYTLVGWKYGDIVVNAGNYATVEYNTTAPTTIYAQWVAVNQNFTIKHWFENADNDSFTEDEDNRVTAQALAGTIVSDIAVDKLNVTGFAFSKIENTHDFIEGNGNTVINVYYVRNRLNITITPEAKGSSIISYNGEVLYNGSVVTSKVLTLKYEQTIALEELTREGYDFVGYLYNGNDFTLNKMPNNSIYLTDKWTPKTATITLDANGGTTAGNVTEITLTFDAKYPVLPTPTKKGYTFKGWYKVNGDNSTSDTKIEFNTSETVTNLENYTIRATWEAYTFTGEYYVDGAQVSTQTWTYDAETAVINVDDVTKSGHTFDGWLLVGGSTYNKGNSVKALFTDAENGEVFRFDAKFTPYTLTVKYYVNGSLKAEKEWKFTDDAKVEIDNPTQKGYTFIGWNGEYTKGESINELFNGKENGAVINLSATFEKNSYSVEFIVNGGLFEGENPSKEYEFDSTITLPNATKTGYTLKWSDGTTEYSAYDEYRLTKDEKITFTAQWTPISSTVKFNTKGGNSVADIEVTYGQTYGQNIPVPTREGYDFDGWYANESYTGSKITFTSATIVELIEDVTYYAKWNAKQYTITFNAGEGQVNPTQITVTYDKAYGRDIPVPTREGYVFGGWFTDEEYTTGNEVSFSATDIVKITSNAVYYAQWALDSYTIIFDATDGSLESGVPEEGEHDFKSTITLPNATKKGYTLKWSDGTTEYSAGSKYEVKAEDVTFEAIWTAYTFTAEYYVDGTKTNTEEWSYDDIETAAITVNNASKSGYTFNNWALVGGGAYNKGDKVKTLIVDADNGTTFTFNAVFTAYTFTAKFYVDGASEATHTQTWTFGEQAVIGAANPTKTGYTFQYWTLRGVGGEYTQGKDVSALFTNADNGEVFEFDSYFKIDSYTVTFDANGGNLTGGNEVSIIFNNPVTLPNATKTGYTLKWKLEGAATADYNAGAEYIVKGPTKFIAEWTANDIIITLNADGGKVNGQDTDTITLTYNQNYKALPTPTRDHYNFIGWFRVDNDQKVTFDTQAKVQITEGFALKAKWQRIVYTVTFDANGGNLTGENPVTINSGDSVNLPTPTRTGYTFKHWTYKGEEYTGTYANVISDMTFVAEWELNTYTVQFVPGNGQTIENETINHGASVDLPTLTREGYTFGGWQITSNGTQYTDSYSPVVGDMTFTAKWTAINITITLDANGGKVNGKDTDTITLTYDQKYVALPTESVVILEGHTFLGWFEIDASGNIVGDAITFNTADTVKLLAGYTLKAKWEVNTYKVTYKVEGLLTGDTAYVDINGNEQKDDGEGVEVLVDVAYGTQIVFPAIIFDGHYDKVWKQNGVTVKDTIIMGTTPLEFVATLTPKAATVTFNTGNGTINVSGNGVGQTYTVSGAKYGDTITLPTASYTGHSYVWKLNGEDYTEATLKVEELTYTFTAVWTPDPYTVAFTNASVGGNNSYVINHVYGSTFNLPNPDEKEGYNILGWKNGETTYNVGTEFTQGLTVYTFEAVWEAVKSTITFDAKGGNVTPEELEVQYDSTYSISIPTPTKTGYGFDGWFTDEDCTAGNEVSFTAGAKVELIEDVTYYAKWTANKYTATFKSQYPDAEEVEIQVTYGQPYGELPALSYTGYTTDGWYVGETKITAETIVTTAGDHDVIGKVTINQYNVTLVLNDGTLVGNTIAGKRNFGTELKLPNAEKTGYTLKWNDGTTDRDAGYTFNLGDADVTFTAVWTPVKVTVKFDDGFDGTIADKEYTYDENYTGLPTPSEQPGYTFEGWYDESGNKIESNTQIKNDGTHTLTAKWSANVIAVTLNANGGNVSNTTIYVQFANKYGIYSDTAIESEDFESLTSKALPTPTRTGYTFKGWKLSGTAVTDTSEVTTATSHSLVAEWEGNKFNVTYHSNVPGNAATHVEEYTYGTAEKLWTSNFTYVDGQKVWTLIGWTTNADGTGTYYSKDENVAFSVSDYDLYAKWSAEFIEFTLEITYDIIDNTGYGVETTTTTQTIIISQDGLAKDGDNFIVPSSAFTINNPYDFAEAYYTENIEDSYTLPQSGGTVEVKYTRNLQTVTLLDPDGEDSGYYMELPYGANITKALVSDDYADFYEGFCLYMAEDAVEGHYNMGFTVNGKELTSESIVDGPVNMQPIYIANRYTILFDKNNASAEQVTGKSTSISFTYDADGTITLPVDLFTLYGYNLTAWKYTASASNLISVDTEYKVNIRDFLATASNDYLLGKFDGYTITIYANWKAKEVQVTLNANNGTVTPTTITVTFGQAYNELPEPTREGYEFDAWYDNNGNVITKDSIVNKENHTLTAEWIAEEITITLNANGGKVNNTLISYLTLTFNSKYKALPTPTREGYTFKGWYRNAEGTGDKVEFDTNATVNSTEEFTLYANWEANTVDIILNANSGKVNGKDTDTITLTYDQKYVALPTPTKEGYDFQGWYKIDEGGNLVGNAITFNTTDTVKLLAGYTLKAKWQIKTFTVTFNPNGGNFDGSNTTIVNWNETVTLPTEDTVTREGHTLAGWQINGSGTIYTETYENVTENMTFVAVWTTDRQTITFVYNNGEADTTTKVNWGGSVTLPTPTKAGYNFTGWEYNGQTYTGSYSPVKGDMTFEATWKAYTFTAEYYVDGELKRTDTWEYDEDATVLIANPTKTGYTFANWKESVTSGTYVSGADITGLFEGKADKHTFRFDAQWTINRHTVTLVLNGGTLVDETIAGTYDYGTELTLPNATKTGYSLKWNDGTTDRDAGYTFNLGDADVTFTAVWTANTYTATFKSQYPDAEEVEIEVTYGKPYGELPALSYTGYTTDGWYVGETKITAETIVTTAGDHDVIGKVTINEYVVTFEGATFDGGKTTMTVDYLEKFQLPEPDELVGNNFLGWKNGETTYSVGTEFTQGLTEYVFIAQWQLKTYTITLDLNYDDAEDIIKTVSHGGTVTLDTPTRTGYTFKHWTNGGKEYTGTFANVTGPMTFVAEWDINSYTVTFNPNGGEIDGTDPSGRLPYGTVIDIPNANREGYTFNGWKLNSAATADYKAGSKYTLGAASATFTADWTINQYNVTLVLDGGTLTSNTIAGKHNFGTELTLPNAEKTGYTFAGWKLNDAATAEYAAGSKYTLGAADVTFTATWAPRTYTVNYYVEDTLERTDTWKYNETATVLIADPEKTGYTFDGWNNNYFNAQSINELFDGTGAVTEINLYARFNINQYNVTLVLDGGTLVGDTIAGKHNFGTELTLPNAEKTGYTFAGWKLNDAATAEYAAGSKYTLGAADVTFTATWTAITIDIILDANGGKVNGADSYTHKLTYDQKYVSLPTATREGYTFLGWFNIDESGNLVGEAVTFNTTEDVKILEGYTLKADWQKNDYDVTFDAVDGFVDLDNDGIHDNDEVIKYVTPVEHGTSMTLPEAYKEGYTFLGWSLNGTEAPVKVYNEVITSELSFVAKYEANTYKITFNTNGGDAISSINVTYDEKYGQDIPEATWKGRVFKGWYKESTFINQVTFTADDIVKLTSDVTYHAKWEVYTFTAIYYVDGTEVDRETWTYNQNYVVTVDDGTKTGHDFNNWVERVSDKTYKKGDSVFELIKDAANKTEFEFDAAFTPQTYTVTLNPNGGTVTPTTITRIFGQTYGELPTPTWAGHKFNYWTLDGVAVDVNTNVTSTGDHELKANWTAYSFEIQYYIDGIYQQSDYVSYDDTVTISVPDPTKTGYTFKGWNGMYYVGDNIHELLVGKGEPDKTTIITLTAVWEAINVIVTFDPNGGTVTPTSKEYTYDSEYEDLPTPTRTGHDFGGWTLEGEIINGSDKVQIATPHTLVAKWTPAVYKVSLTIYGVMYDSSSKFVNGGNTTLDIYVLYGSTFGKYIIADSRPTADAFENEASKDLPAIECDYRERIESYYIYGDYSSFQSNTKVTITQDVSGFVQMEPKPFEVKFYTMLQPMGVDEITNPTQTYGLVNCSSGMSLTDNKDGLYSLHVVYNIYSGMLTFTAVDGYYIRGIYTSNAYDNKITEIFNGTFTERWYGITNTTAMKDLIMKDGYSTEYYIVLEKASVLVTLTADAPSVNGFDNADGWTINDNVASKRFDALTYTEIVQGNLVTPRVPGYKFDGWRKDGVTFTNYTVPRAARETLELSVTPGDGLIKLLSAEIEFKALDGNSVRQDDFNNFDVASGYTFEITNVNGCSINDTIVSGIALSRFTFTASLDGYEYIGLYIDGVRVDNNNSYVITEDVILEARFVAKRIIVNIEKYVLQDGTYVFSELGGQVSVFDAMGGVISPINPANPTVFEVFHGETLTIEGSANAGFSVDAIYKDYIGNGATSVDDSKVIAGGVFTPEYNESAAVQDKSIKLSIVFETKLYTIKATGEESWEEDGVTFTPNYPTFLTNAVVGNSFTITNPTGTSGSKKVFLGYEYGGHLYVSGDTFKLTSEIIEMNGDNAIIELRAVWSFASIIVTVEKPDGTTTVTNYANNSDLQTAINALVAENNAEATITIDLFGEFVNSEFNNVYNLSDAIFGNNLTDGKLIIRSEGIASIVIKKGLGNMFTGSNYSIEIGEGIVLDGNASSGSLIAISATKSTSAKVEIYGMIQNAMTGAVKLTQYNADINGMFVNNQGTIFEFVHGETNNTNSTLSGWFANNNAGESALISGAGDFTNAFVALDSLMFANNIGKIAIIGSLNKMQYYDISEIAIENHTADSDDALFFVEYEEGRAVNAVRFNGLNITASNIGTLISAYIVDFNEYIFISDSNTFTYSFDSDVTSNMLYVDASSIYFNVSDASYVSNLANKRLTNTDLFGTQIDTNNPYFGKLYLIGDPNIPNTGEYTWEINDLVVDTLIGPSEIREYGKELYILGNGVVADNVYGQFRITGNAKVYNVYGEVTFDSLFNVNQSPYINIHSDKMNEVAFHYGNIDIANALMPKLTLISSDAEAFIANVRSHAWIAKGPFAVLSTKANDPLSGQAGYKWVNGKLTWTLGYSEPVGTFFDLTGVDMSVSGWETDVGLPSGYNSTTIVITENTTLNNYGNHGWSVVAAGNDEAITLNGAYYCTVGTTGGKIIVESVNTDSNGYVGLGYNAQIRSSLISVGSGYIDYNGGSLYYGFDESTALKENPLFSLQNKMFVEDIDTYNDLLYAYGGIVNANTLTLLSDLKGNAIVTGNADVLRRIGGNATILGTLGVSSNNKVEIDGTYWYGSVGEIVYDGEYNEETIILSSNYLEQDNINAKVRVNDKLVTFAKLAAPVDGYYGFIANDKNYAVQVGDQVFESINDEAIAAALASSDKTIHLIRDITASDITADINNINIIIDGHNSATIDMAGASQFEKATIKDVTITGGLAGTFVIDGEVNYTGNTAQITADITVNGTLNVFNNTFDGYIFAPSALAGNGTINIYQNNASGALISDGAVAKLNVYDNSGAGVMITGAVTELDNVMISKNGGDGLVIDALGATYIEITNITITGNNGHGVVANNPANRTAHVSMSNYAITNNAGNGIEFTTDTRVSQQFVLADGMILSNGEYGINLYDGYELTIAGAIVYGSGSVGVNINSGVAILDMGTITGFETGVYIKSGARFDMNYGTIANCSEYGVYVDANANFNMTGGEIANISSSATTYSLTTPIAVKILGNAIIDQGSISNSAIGIDLDALGNLDLADGALINNCTTGLSVNSDFTFTGGTIYNCATGIVSNNKVIIAGGAIAETGIAFNGQGALKVEGGYIYSCDVVVDTPYGSGSDGTEYAFEMTGGEIDNCSTIMETATYAKVSGGRITNVHIAFTINSILIEGDAYISGTGEENSTLGWSGTLTMSGGVVENFDIAAKDMSYDQGYGLVNTVTINDGVIRNCGIAAQGLNITMNGGRIENCEIGLEGKVINFGGDAVITHDLAENGSIVADTTAICGVSDSVDDTINITGGTIENYNTAAKETAATEESNAIIEMSNGLIQNCTKALIGSKFNITGGTVYNCQRGVTFDEGSQEAGIIAGGEFINDKSINASTAIGCMGAKYATITNNVKISGFDIAISLYVATVSATIENCETGITAFEVYFNGIIKNCTTAIRVEFMQGRVEMTGGVITNDLDENGNVKTGTKGIIAPEMQEADDYRVLNITGGAISNCEVGIMSNIFMNDGDEITGVKISNCTYGISNNNGNIYNLNLGAGVEITDCDTGVNMKKLTIADGVKFVGCGIGVTTSDKITMTGGEISNCTKGVCVDGEGVITAGTLTNCEIAIEGQNITFGGTATITNDLVEGKVKTGTTGIKAQLDSNPVSMTGGEISNCEYGVDVTLSGLYMSNGEIKNCTYGISNNEKFTYSTSISGSAKITDCQFGIYNIYTDEAPAEVKISGGTISGCSTAVVGDKVTISGTATITNGDVGVRSQYELSMTAGTISVFEDKAIYCFGSANLTGGTISNCEYGVVKDAYGLGEGNIVIGPVQVTDCEVGACFSGTQGTNVDIGGRFTNCSFGVIIEHVNSGTIKLGASIQNFNSCGISIINSSATITMNGCMVQTNVEATIAVGYTGSQESLTINGSGLTATTGISLDSGKITINSIMIEYCEKGIEATATGTIVAKYGEIFGCDYGIYAPEGSVEDFAMTITTTGDGVVGVQAGTIVTTGGEISNMTTGIIVGESAINSSIGGISITNCKTGIYSESDGSLTINATITIDEDVDFEEETIGVNVKYINITGGTISGYDIGVNMYCWGTLSNATIQNNKIGVNVTSGVDWTTSMSIQPSGLVNNEIGLVLDSNFIGSIDVSATIAQNSNGGVKVYGGTLVVEGANITMNALNGEEKLGAGIYVNGANANLTITSGSIFANAQDSGKARFGGGVYFAGNTFTMDGGRISNNAATEAGGGVYIAAGQMIINGGSIETNTVVNTDKDVYGAGIYVANYTLPTGVSSALNISGGSISANSITSENGDEYGAGLYIDNVAVMSAGIVRDHNAVNGKAKYGGGAYITENGSLTMNGGAFLNNYATVDGGGIYDNGTFVMTGGTVSYNGTATNDTTIESKEYFTIVFDGDGADSGSIAAVMVVKVTGETTGTTKLPVNKFVKDGYTFGGWEYTDANGNTASIAPGSDLVYVEAMASNGVITLTAIWNEITE